MTTSRNKKTKGLIKLSLLASAASILSSQAIASDAIGPGDSGSKWVLGASLDVYNNPYSGEDNTAEITPNIKYNGERFFIKDGTLNLHLTETHGFSGGLKLALDGGFLSEHRDYEDNEKLAGLTEREGTILGGIYMNHDTGLGRLNFSALTDLGDEHDGQAAKLKYTFDLKAGNWNINPVLGVEWLSDELVNHYTGVSANEVTASRAVFSGKETVNVFAGIRARYEITDKWDVNVATGAVKLGSEITDSPIVEDDVVYQASLGFNYNF